MLRLGMRVAFMGSPKFAVPSLHKLAANYDIIGVFTQPDRPSGRGRQMHPSAVKSAALEMGLRIFQPKKVRHDEAVAELQQLAPDLIVVAAYGHILSKEILDIPKHGSVNVHASLLPRWRGAAPIQAAILNGDKTTGITIMLMDVGMDTGPVLSQQELEIKSTETSGELSDRLSTLGAELLQETLPGYLNGQIIPTSQDDDLATYAGMIRKSEGLLDFNKPSRSLALQIRAFEPWPTSYFYWDDRRIVVRQAHAERSDLSEIGLVTSSKNLPAIVTQEGVLTLDLVQPAGKKVMPGDSFLRGSPNFVGSILTHHDQFQG